MTIGNFDIYSEITPKIPNLYHYTSQAGILGIITNKNLWFTNIHFMNDSTEYTYSLELIKNFIEKFYDFGGDDLLFKLFPSDKDIEPIFSFSLSEYGDLLSQWRGYCPNGGYSISFFDSDNVDHINQVMKTNDLYIGKCLYENDLIEELIIEKIVEFSPEQFAIEKQMALISDDFHGWLKGQYHKIIRNTFKFAPLIKHPAFKEEAEWRIVASYAESRQIGRAPKNVKFSTNPSGSLLIDFDLATIYEPFDEQSEMLRFRPGKSFLIPFLEFPLTSGDPLIIPEVIVGPTPHEELSLQACQLLLKKNKAKVTVSKLPYRNW